jgi:hypothetical protein
MGLLGRHPQSNKKKLRSTTKGRKKKEKEEVEVEKAGNTEVSISRQRGVPQ